MRKRSKTKRHISIIIIINKNNKYQYYILNWKLSVVKLHEVQESNVTVVVAYWRDFYMYIGHLAVQWNQSACTQGLQLSEIDSPYNNTDDRRRFMMPISISHGVAWAVYHKLYIIGQPIFVTLPACIPMLPYRLSQTFNNTTTKHQAYWLVNTTIWGIFHQSSSGN